MSALAVGQRLWYVSSESLRGKKPEGKWVVVSKIGHKWAYIKSEEYGFDYGKIGVDDLIADGGQYSSPGRCYVSEQAYEDEENRREEWDRFYRAVSDHHRCPDITVEDIRYACEILKITPKRVSE